MIKVIRNHKLQNFLQKIQNYLKDTFWSLKILNWEYVSKYALKCH